jgi:hypothetical protein
MWKDKSGWSLEVRRERQHAVWTGKLMKQLVERMDGHTEEDERTVNQGVIVRGQTVVVIGSDDKFR